MSVWLYMNARRLDSHSWGAVRLTPRSNLPHARLSQVLVDQLMVVQVRFSGPMLGTLRVYRRYAYIDVTRI